MSTNPPMMECGHAANATTQTGAPACAICSGPDALTVSTRSIDLTGRYASCTCGTTVPSSLGLAFFEYQGEGSGDAVSLCKCGYHAIAHGEINPRTKRPGITDHEFTPRGGRETDRFYCGCRGWD